MNNNIFQVSKVELTINNLHVELIPGRGIIRFITRDELKIVECPIKDGEKILKRQGMKWFNIPPIRAFVRHIMWIEKSAEKLFGEKIK